MTDVPDTETARYYEMDINDLLNVTLALQCLQLYKSRLQKTLSIDIVHFPKITVMEMCRFIRGIFIKGKPDLCEYFSKRVGEDITLEAYLQEILNFLGENGVIQINQSDEIRYYSLNDSTLNTAYIQWVRIGSLGSGLN